MKAIRYQLTLPIPPSSNRWWRKFGTRMVKDQAVRDYQAAVRLKLLAERVRPIRPPATVAVDMTWYRARQSGDLDKRLGIALDALQGTAFENDAQVVELHAYRREDKRNPRLEVVIYEIVAEAAA